MPVQPPSIDLSRVPSELREHDCWVCWRFEDREGKPTKVPYDAVSGLRASTIDQTTWHGFETAVAAFEGGGYEGVGFVFAEGGGFCGIDLDDCIGEDGVISDGALAIIAKFASYAEISPSGRGVKIFIRGVKPEGARSKVRTVPGTKAVEVYDHGRFFTVTGWHVEGTSIAVNDRQAELEAFCREIFPPEPKRATGAATTAAAASGGADPDDARLLDRARRAANGAKFSRLYDKGDTSEYGGDESAADLALCSLLWYWTRDRERVDRLFRGSALCRDKWERDSYRVPTLDRACEGPVRGTLVGSKTMGSNPSDPSQFALTDLGNAERLAAERRHRLRYCVSTGRWLEWNGNHWADDDQGAVFRHAGAVVRSMLSAAASTDESGSRMRLAEWAVKSEGRQRLDAMVAIAQTRSELIVRASDLDADPFAFNCLNGTIDLRTGVLRDADPDDLITKTAEVWFDPSAGCPRFLAFLDRIFAGDAHAIRFVQRFLGMCLTGDITEQYLPIFHGSGANGKSVLCDLMLNLFGRYATIAPASLITSSGREEHPTEIADLFGRRLVIASESEGGAELKLQQVKRLTGDTKLKGRFMRKDFFEFDRTHKLIMVTNNPPIVRENTEAVWRRVRIVPFNVTIPPEERDPALLGKLLEEGSGILNWLIQGCIDWQRDGLGHAVTVEDATREYQKSQDDPACFLDECFERQGDASESTAEWFVPWATVSALYRRWCAERDCPPMSDRKLGAALDRMGVTTGLRRVNGISTKGREGVRLRPEATLGDGV